MPASRPFRHRFLFSTFFSLLAIPLAALLLGGAVIATALGVDYAPIRENPSLPHREFRGAWVASVYNLDWPSRPGLSAAAQQAELRRIMDKAVSLRMNAIILQVRPAGDALYRSAHEPWSYYLTGKMGRAASYDPLTFAVNEAHRRGLELHAWFNPFRAAASTKITPSRTHVIKKYPGWIRRYNNQLWMDPGLPEVRAHSIKVIMDVVNRYDIDGVHLDDYFYPYPKKNSNFVIIERFPDGGAYRKYGRGKNLGDWRRANIDSFVETLYRSIKGKKSWVKFGISPFGIWRPRVPGSIEARLDSYHELYADSRKWLDRGWCDYFSPQLYWRIGPREQSFPVLNQWWNSQNSKKRHLWPGISSARIDSKEDPGRPASEIIRQIGITRQGTSSAGHIHWNMKALMANRGGINNLLAKSTYAPRALVPASPWLGSRAPAAATGLRATADNANLNMTWSSKARPRSWVIQAKSPRTKRWELVQTVPGSAGKLTFGHGGNVPLAVAVSPMSATGVLGTGQVVGRK